MVLHDHVRDDFDWTWSIHLCRLVVDHLCESVGNNNQNWVARSHSSLKACFGSQTDVASFDIGFKVFSKARSIISPNDEPLSLIEAKMKDCRDGG